MESGEFGFEEGEDDEDFEEEEFSLDYDPK